MKKSIILLIVFAFLSFLVVSSCSEMKDPVSGINEDDEAIIDGVENERVAPVIAIVGCCAANYIFNCVGSPISLGDDVMALIATNNPYTGVFIGSGIAGTVTCAAVKESFKDWWQNVCDEPGKDEIYSSGKEIEMKPKPGGIFDFDDGWKVKDYDDNIYYPSLVKFKYYHSSTNKFQNPYAEIGGSWKYCRLYFTSGGTTEYAHRNDIILPAHLRVDEE